MILIFGTGIIRNLLGQKNTSLYDVFLETPILNVFVLFSPITSFLFSFSYMMDSFDNYNYDKLKNYMFRSYIIQGLQFFFYFLLFILMEVGYLKKFFNWLKLKFFLRENNFIFSEEQLPEEFLLNNN